MIIAAEPRRESEIALREITGATVGSILRLVVAPEQERFVASNAVSIAQAYFQRENAWFRAICADEAPVGFLMLDDRPAISSYYLWRFMIDRRFQGRGFGRRAIDLLVDHVRCRPGAKVLKVSCVPGVGSPCPFYQKLGFRPTGEIDEGEIVLELIL